MSIGSLFHDWIYKLKSQLLAKQQTFLNIIASFKSFYRENKLTLTEKTGLKMCFLMAIVPLIEFTASLHLRSTLWALKNVVTSYERKGFISD